MVKKKMPSQFPEKKFIEETIFPDKIFNSDYFKVLTDNTCCKPRNIVSWLNLVKTKYPGETTFRSDMFTETETEYSAKVWKEIEYLLGASHSDRAIKGLKRVLFAKNGRFTLNEFEVRISELERYVKAEMTALKREGYVQALERMFDYGAIGNVYRDHYLNRSMYVWSFRREDVFQIDRPMEVQKSLWKHLSITNSFTVS